MRPYLQIGFMPEALSVKPEPYRHHWTPAAKYGGTYTVWTYPPKDWAKWEELVYQWKKHRHGRDRHAHGFHFLPREGQTSRRRRPRADGHFQPTPRHRQCLRCHRTLSGIRQHAHRHRRVRSGRLSRLTVTSDSAIPLPEILRSGVRNQSGVSAISILAGKKPSVLVWHYHDDDLTGPDAAFTLKIPGLPVASGQAKVTHYRVDETHGNSFTLWKALGLSQKPTPEQYADLEAAGN